MTRLRSTIPDYKPSLRERFDSFVLPRLFPQRMNEMSHMVDILEKAYERGGLLMPPEKVIQQLSESGQLVDLIMRTRGRAFGLGHELSERDREGAVAEATYMFQSNVNIEKAVRTWTDFGLGQRVDLRSDDQTADVVLDEFWGATRNSGVIGQRHLHERSEDALNEGELAFIFWYSTLDGSTTVRKMGTQRLKVIFDDPKDKTVPIMYIEERGDQKVVYRDWKISKTQFAEELQNLDATHVSADEFSPTINIDGDDIPVTEHVVLWVTRNRNTTLGRGMPQFLGGFEWARVLQDFMGDRAAVARKAAIYTEKVNIDGGSRELKKFKQRTEQGLYSNDRLLDRAINTPAASDWVENTGVNREWMNRSTGATAARFDGRMLAGQLSVNTGVGLHWMGFPDALANRSTAEEILRPFWQQIQRYQAWWVSVIEDMGAIVLSIADEFGAVTLPLDTKISVTLEVPVSMELEQLITLLTEIREMIMSGIVPADVGQEVVRELTLLALDKLGVRDPKGTYVPNTGEPMLTPTDTGAGEEVMETIMGNWREGTLDSTAVLEYLSDRFGGNNDAS
jgi:hypothetical protein